MSFRCHTAHAWQGHPCREAHAHRAEEEGYLIFPFLPCLGHERSCLVWGMSGNREGHEGGKGQQESRGPSPSQGSSRPAFPFPQPLGCPSWIPHRCSALGRIRGQSWPDTGTTTQASSLGWRSMASESGRPGLDPTLRDHVYVTEQGPSLTGASPEDHTGLPTL